MTQEKKARAYNNGIWQNHLYRTNNSYYANELNYIFPELKESEDEKIRKQILSFLKEFEYDHYRNLDFSSWIAWLEKQESCYSFEIKKGHWYKCVCDYMLNNSDLMFKNDRLYYCRSDWRLRDEIDERNVKNIGVNGYKSFFRPATNQEIKEWLEKQGNKDSQIKLPMFTFDDILALQCCMETVKKVQNDKDLYEKLNDLHGRIYDAYYLEKQGEQNPIDKVEPKFKVGDWISNDMCDVHIASIENGMYYFDEGDGLSIVFVDEHYHIWTIEDAMDGDVLAFDDETIVIFKDLYNKTSFHSYCHIEDGVFNISKDDMPDWWEGEGFYPATRKQRDILFSKMKKAGYEWHINKKELRKKE